jgi:four helix bundle protein
MAKENISKSENFKRKLYQFVLRLIRFIEQLPNSMVTKIMGNQLLRSGTSILGNYIEGKSASSKKDYINFFNHSLKSANESKVWLAILRDLNYGNKGEIEWLLTELDEISRIFASSLLTLKGKKKSI